MDSVTQESFDKLVGAVERLTSEMEQQKAMLNELWGAEEIGKFLKLKTRSVQQAIINRKRCPSFPAPKILPTGGRRWAKEQVIEWAKNH